MRIGGAWKLVVAALILTVPGAVDGAEPEVLDKRLELTLFCEQPEIVTPVGIDIDSAGRIWAIESNTHFPKADYNGHASDRILVIADSDSDGKADRFDVFTDGLQQTMGLKLVDDRHVLLATRREIFLYEDADGDFKSDGRKSLARLETGSTYPHNGLSGFELDAFGNVFFGMGENFGAPYKLIGSDGKTLTGSGEGGSVYRVRPDGSALTRVATGYWNPFHLAFDAFGNLFTVDNDPDGRPPCRLLDVVTGGDHGYRYRYGRGGQHPFSSWNGRLPDTLPMLAGTGEAPSGVLAYESDGLPPEYRGALLVTSWGDHFIERYTLAPAGASFTARREIIVRGDENFRPVGIATAPDGSVYFSDWVDKSYNVHGRGRIWRLSRRKASVRKPAEALGAGELAHKRVGELLAHPDRAIREQAVRALAGRDGAEAICRQLIRKSRDDRVRCHALVFLARKGVLGVESLRKLAASGASGRLLTATVRLLGKSSAAARKAGLPALLSEGVLDRHPRARMEAILALDELADMEGPLLRLAAETGDSFLRSAALQTLARLGSVERFELLAGSSDARIRLTALLALRRMGGVGRTAALLVEPSQKSSIAVVSAFLRDGDPAVRAQALRWAGEAGLQELSAELDKALESGPLTRDVLDFYLAARGLLGGENPHLRDRKSRDQSLYEVAVNASRPAALRRQALRGVSPGFSGWKKSQVEALLADSSAGLRLEMMRSLRDGTMGFAGDLLAEEASDEKQAPGLRREAVIGLALHSNGKLAVLEGLLRSGPAALRAEAARSLRGVKVSEESAALLRELDGAARLAGRPAKLPSGDPAEGERVFFHPKGPRCSSCHSLGGRGGLVGPDLSLAGALSPQRLLDSIFEPSKEIAPQFTTWVLVTREGPRTGILLADDPDGSLRLAEAGGQVRKIKPAAVLRRQPQKVSLMPGNLHELMTLKELANLVAFLKTAR
jgi:putative membrane-bound dehydrogenase-like protein